MKFDCLQENLSKGLLTVSRFTPTRAQLPILANILISAKNGELKLGATNLESGIVLQIGAKIEEEGEITVPAKIITDLINSLPPGKIEFISEDNNLKIGGFSSKTTLSCLPASEFPPFPISKKGGAIKLTKEELKGPVLLTSYCAANDESRPVLSGIKIFIKNNNLAFVATDGYRLSLKTTPVKAGEGLEKGLILPARTLTEIVKILEEDEEGMVELELSSLGQVIFKLKNAEIFCRLIEGQYPDFEKIIPSSFKTSARVLKKDLAAAVKTTAIFAKDSANIIKFKIESAQGGSGLRVSANAPQIGGNESEVEAKIEGEENEIAFNCRFLQEFLNIIEGEEIVFEMGNSLSPGVFKILGDSSFLHLIMPVRITE